YSKVTRWVEFLTVWRLRTVMFMLQVEEPSDQQWGVYNYASLSNTSKSKRQHSCTVCGRQFSTSRDLGRHHMTHTGEKPFHCPYCPHRANRKGNLKFHIIASIKCGQYCFQGFESSSFSTAFITASASASYTTVQEEQQQQHRRCNICGKVFRGESSKSNLKQHMSIHRGEKPFKCPICNHRSNRRNNLKIHMQCMHSIGKWIKILSVVPLLFAGSRRDVVIVTPTLGIKFLLTRHLITHTGEKPYQCRYCSYRANVSSNLSRHIKTVHAQEKLSSQGCDNSPTTLQNASTITATTPTTVPDDPPSTTHALPFKSCEICGRKFLGLYQTTLLKRHMRIHTGERPYPCPFCPYRANIQSNVSRHIKSNFNVLLTCCVTSVFTRARNRSCALSARLGAPKAGMSVDMLKQHECSICGYKFRWRWLLVRHMRIHTGEKPFACPYCSYRATRKEQIGYSSSITIEKPVTDVSSYTCHICFKSFHFPSLLERHLRIHTGDRPFPCQFCSYRGKRKDHLDSHLRLHAQDRNQ
ncbi:Zinc finger protein, partial [Armadillidium nasatum]